MKKLTSLQILMILGLGLSSSSIFCSSDIMEMDMDEAVAADQARDEVLADLAELYPAQVERIIADEVDLESTFNSVRNFVNKKNKEIESLSQQAAVSEADIARLAIELADAQAALAETEAKNNVKNKKSLRQGQPIKDALMKAQQNLKRLSDQAVSGFVDFGNSIVKNGKKAGKAINKSVTPKKSKKAARKEQSISADEAIAMMDNQLAQDEVVVQTIEDQNTPSEKTGKNKDWKDGKKGKKGTVAIMDNQVTQSDEVVVQATEDQNASSAKTGKDKDRKGKEGKGKGKGKKDGKKGKKDNSVESQDSSEDDSDV